MERYSTEISHSRNALARTNRTRRNSWYYEYGESRSLYIGHRRSAIESARRTVVQAAIKHRELELLRHLPHASPTLQNPQKCRHIDHCSRYAARGQLVGGGRLPPAQRYRAIERIDGDFYTVMGFPLGLFVRSLAERGITLGRAG